MTSLSYYSYQMQQEEPKFQPASIYLLFLLLMCAFAAGSVLVDWLQNVQDAKQTRMRQHIATITTLLPQGTSAELLVSYSQKYGSNPTTTRPLPPIFTAIAACESGGKQFHANGQVIRGRINRNDIGKYQINLTIWGRTAQELGYNIFSEEGNEEMALELYRRHGLQPWYLSKHCWGKREI